VAHEPGLDVTTFLLGFFGGCMAVSLSLAVFSSFWQTRLTSKVAQTISWACGLMLIGFGFRLGYSIWMTFNAG
jgi:threonine/homoserine/homoserine lactone efflux protein